MKQILRPAQIIDSEALAQTQRQNLDISRTHAIQLGRIAYEAMKNESYLHNGQAIKWRSEIQQAIAQKVSIAPSCNLKHSQSEQFLETEIVVVNQSTLSVAHQLVSAGFKPLTLNFANGIEPGGGFLTGGRAQEETLCRASALYLTLVDDPMYAAHAKRPLPDSSDWAIYSPQVPVFCDDSGQSYPRPWLLDFISCAAPYAPRLGHDYASVLLKQRTDRILSIACSFGYTTLILGAWGCGAFGNDPARTAQDFKQALLTKFAGRFAKIVFAIVDWSPERKFLRPFQQAFAMQND